MDRLLFVFTQKLAIVFVAGLTTLGGFLSMGSINPSAQSQTAIIADIAPGTTSGTMMPATAAWPDIMPGLLPSTTPPFCTASSTCGMKSIKALAVSFRLASLRAAAQARAASSTRPTSTAQTRPILAHPTSTVKMVPVAAKNITAQALLASTTVTFKEQRTGPYEVVLKNVGLNIAWPIAAATVGGNDGSGETGGIPQFASSYSCAPAPDLPDPGAADQSPLFETGRAYDCTVSLTPTAGADRRTQSKDFSFTVPAGQLVVTVASAMNTVLTNETNNGGIVFNNEDASPVTVTGLTFDVSYTALNTTDHPLILRFLDPATNQSLFDYHLENLPKDPTLPYTNTQAGVPATFSFTIGGAHQRMLPVQILGVEKMLMQGTSPTVKITVKNVMVNRNGMQTVMASPQVAWSCVVALGAYDPNATNSAFAAGDACRD